MATCNSTETLQASARRPFGFPASFDRAYEKISCSMADGTTIDPFSLMGLHLRLAEVLEIDNGVGDDRVLESSMYSGVVVGVLIGSSFHNVSTELLIIPDGYSEPDHVPVDRLTVLSLIDDQKLQMLGEGSQPCISSS
jgi:hypothetical protein